MAVVYIQEFAFKDWSTANYDWAKEQIGDDPIDGLIVHTAGFDKNAKVFRIMDVWESQEQADRFIRGTHPANDGTGRRGASRSRQRDAAHARDVLRASRRERPECDGFRTLDFVAQRSAAQRNATRRSGRWLVTVADPNI